MIVAELVDGCKLKCALCWNRNRTPSLQNMTLPLVSYILEKYKGSRIEWFNWGDPLLHPDIIKISSMVRRSNSSLSSSFSMKLSNEIIDAIQQFKRIYISASGIDKRIYSIYHRGGNFDLVQDNINRLIERKNTRIIFRCASHRYNTHHIEKVKEFCSSNNIEFEECLLNCEVEELIEGFQHPMLRPMKSARGQCRMLPWDIIGVNGDLYVCCASHNIPIGYTVFDNINQKDLIEAKMRTSVCATCCQYKYWGMF